MRYSFQTDSTEKLVKALKMLQKMETLTVTDKNGNVVEIQAEIPYLSFKEKER